MDRKLSVQDYDLFYRNALFAMEQVQQTVPKVMKKFDEYQDICRVCGCLNDGHFVHLDKYQDFDFEPTITTYRMLFKHASLQFEFHTMPDLPTCICRICAYKAKIFYLMTRQFLIGQQIMRAAVTDFYRDTYGIEPPEHLEDLQRMCWQLNMIPKQRNQVNSRPGLTRQPSKLNRSTSTVTRTECGSKLAMNIQQPNKTPAQNLGKKTRSAPSPANDKKGFTEMQPMQPMRPMSRLDRTDSSKKLSPIECHIKPRMTGKSIRVTNLKEPEILKNGLTYSEDYQDQTSQADDIEMPLSKAQRQKKLLERRKQWR